MPSKALKRKIRKETIKREAMRLIFQTVCAAAATYLLFSYIFGLAEVDGFSMRPILYDGDTVFYTRIFHEYKPGDIIVFSLNKRNYIKRIAAVGGDMVNISTNGSSVQVNGRTEPLDQNPTYPRGGGLRFPVIVPKGCVFVLGDNREASIDSRAKEIGMLPANNICGVVRFVIRRSLSP